MKEFRTGNVVKTKEGSIIIISDVRDDTTSWISFDYENVSGVMRNNTYIRKDMCFCHYNNQGQSREDCDDCKGKGIYDVTIYGMDKAVFLAPSVKEYILKRLQKNFWDEPYEQETS